MRPQAVAGRHAKGLRTARENVADLCDPDSFVEYGAFAYAAQTKRRPVDDLIRQTPADGMVTGLGSVNGRRCAVLAYDATVLAGTQGLRNHQKTDRLLGAHILGPGAGTLIHECVMAMEFQGSSEDVARAFHGHPTHNEAIKEAAMSVRGKAIHV